jgi:hypothetical protein
LANNKLQWWLFGMFISFVFTQNLFLLERKDFPLLKMQLNNSKAYLLIVLDLLIFNSLILISSLYKEQYIATITGLVLIFGMSLLLYLRKQNYHFKLPFSLIDPLYGAYYHTS